MGSQWHVWCRGRQDLELDGDRVTVRFASGRKQRVRVTEAERTFELSSVVVGVAGFTSIAEPAVRAWRRNRSSHLVGFKLDGRGRLVAEAWVPKAGVTAEEFLAHLSQVATEADLFEYQLTGRDRE